MEKFETSDDFTDKMSCKKKKAAAILDKSWTAWVILLRKKKKKSISVNKNKCKEQMFSFPQLVWEIIDW